MPIFVASLPGTSSFWARITGEGADKDCGDDGIDGVTGELVIVSDDGVGDGEAGSDDAQPSFSLPQD